MAAVNLKAAEDATQPEASAEEPATDQQGE